jgi:hypothetical protein
MVMVDHSFENGFEATDAAIGQDGLPMAFVTRSLKNFPPRGF